MRGVLVFDADEHDACQAPTSFCWNLSKEDDVPYKDNRSERRLKLLRIEERNISLGRKRS